MIARTHDVSELCASHGDCLLRSASGVSLRLDGEPKCRDYVASVRVAHVAIA
jgi:hypothetical protein